MLFWEEHFLKKRAFCLLAPPKQMPFLAILTKILFSKIKALDWVRAPNKCLEQALVTSTFVLFCSSYVLFKCIHTKNNWIKSDLIKPLSQLWLCQGLRDSTYPFPQPHTQIHQSFLSMLMLPKQITHLYIVFNSNWISTLT